MRILLDTHAWLWWIAKPSRLGPLALALISSGDNEVYLSAASSWEIAIKVRLGRLTLPEPPDRFVPSRMERDRLQALPVTHAHALEVAHLPLHHRDPFDRILVAQSRIENFPLLTSDPAMSGYEVELLAADR